MTQKMQNILALLAIYSVLLAGGILMFYHTGIDFEPRTYTVLLSSMTIITLGAYLLFMAGAKRKETERGMFLMAAIGGKFIAYLIMILIFWSGGKKLSTEFIIVFFILYLLLTIFLARVLYKTLKIN
jgi:peptidoglycan/LPS O-acetylase OafA/YrhL